MKKFIIVLLAAVLGLSMTSCLTKTKATVDVKVINVIDEPIEGATVYMFTTSAWDAVRLPAGCGTLLLHISYRLSLSLW